MRRSGLSAFARSLPPFSPPRLPSAAAALLIMIVVVAHRIAVLAKTAIAVLLEIETNTKSIWELNTSRKVASDLLDGATAIENNAGAILNALSKTEDDQAA